MCVGGGGGGGKKREGEGGQVKFYPYKKGGNGKSFSHAEEGHNEFCGGFNMGA